MPSSLALILSPATTDFVLVQDTSIDCQAEGSSEYFCPGETNDAIARLATKLEAKTQATAALAYVSTKGVPASPGMAVPAGSRSHLEKCMAMPSRGGMAESPPSPTATRHMQAHMNRRRRDVQQPRQRSANH